MPLELILLLVFMVFFWFAIIRPARKQAINQATMQSNLEEGSRVMLASGLFGTVRHIGDRQVIMELCPGTEVTVSKQAISKIVRPEEEDFEYDDEVTPTETDVVADVAEDAPHPDFQNPDSQNPDSQNRGQ